jgi:hypothetical protein
VIAMLAQLRALRTDPTRLERLHALIA